VGQWEFLLKQELALLLEDAGFCLLLEDELFEAKWLEELVR